MGSSAGIKVRNLLVQRDGPGCFWCERITHEPGYFGRPPTAPDARTADHVITRSRGGSNHVDNLVIACLRCNGERGDLTAEEWLAELDRRDEAAGVRLTLQHAREMLAAAQDAAYTLPRWPFFKRPLGA